MNSSIAEGIKNKMSAMSDAEFEADMGLSKQQFAVRLVKKKAQEAGCVAEYGALAPDFTAHLLGEDSSPSENTVTLSGLRGNPTTLIFGCYTCPIFRRQTDRMKELIAAYDSRINFLFVYIYEAHPIEVWLTKANEKENLLYTQPATLKERAKIAADWRNAYGLTSRILLDWPDNRINDDYSGMPERLYVLDSQGVVTFRSEQGPYSDEHLEDWAAALADIAGG